MSTLTVLPTFPPRAPRLPPLRLPRPPRGHLTGRLGPARVRALPASLAVAVGSGVAGLVLAVLGARLGPAAVVGLPLVVLLVPWALRQPLVGVGLVPLAWPLGDATVAGLSVVQLASVAASALLLARLGLHRVAGALPRATPWVLLLGLSLALSLPRSPELSVGVALSVALLTGGGFALLLPSACRRPADFRRLVELLVVAGGAACALGFVRSGTVSASAGGENVSGSHGLFSEHNQAGAFAAVVVLLAVGALLGARNAWSRLVLGLAGLAAVVQLGLALSRGAYIGCTLGLLVLLATQPTARRAFGRLLLPVAALAVGLAVAAPQSPLSIVGQRVGSITSAADNPYDDRPAIWSEAMREFAASPWVGQGPGAYPYVSTRSVRAAQGIEAEHAHNVLLTVAAELGGLGLVAVVGLTLAVGLALLRAGRAARDPRDAVLVAAVAGALATILGQGLVDVTLRNSYLSTTCWLLVGLAFAADRLFTSPDPSPALGRGSGYDPLAGQQAGPFPTLNDQSAAPAAPAAPAAGGSGAARTAGTADVLPSRCAASAW